MIKLKSINIVGFKEQNRAVSLIFSSEPITVIYGENGSGKTTLLKILHAIFNKNEQYLFEENVREIELVYEKIPSDIKKLLIKVNKSNNNVSWGDNIKDLTKETSVLFGVNRGVIRDGAIDFYAHDFARSISRLRNDMRHSSSFRSSEELDYLLHKFTREVRGRESFTTDWYKENHISVDLIGIDEIESAIIRQSRAGQRATSDKVKNAFFNTISSAVDIEVEKKNYELPIDFEERIDKKRTILISLVEKLDNSSLQSKLVRFLNNNQKTSEIENSKIFRAMLVNILEKVEEENLELKSISQLIEIFNAQLYRNKKLVVTDEEAFIEFAQNKKHKLDKLSSGERHLLTFLTLFLIIGRNRSFFIIDEPEISLNMKWQRELMPLLSELSPNSQIIVATHSPSIANKNSKYLVELV